ncbi:peptidyl-prolyl cis-trans isomerase [Carboxylicivirga marina]|uniref:Peptidyl-prolyl cis-trans isomerase n=1 Tax=Carboxylicivirga marina TaxID=2800988 RepID=A0ABS1HJE6_9BACT|nr:peptidylprolyl isomerase [Carboxylicivirga marina]MBK3517802.1 peptidyl-prolyl cis-trans isomerase [Carboxylicivirga marina]
MNYVRRILKHPLFIFIICGTALYFIYEAVGQFVENTNKKVVVTNAQIDLLREDYLRTWNRYPTEEEMQNQIYGHVMDEIFYKEAVNMGLDKSDVAVKKRLRQLMEMMLDDYSTVYATEQQLRDYLTANPDKFRDDSRITFSQLYFDKDDKETAIEVLEKLKKGAGIEQHQKYSLMMLPIDFASETMTNVARKTGREFADQVFKLKEQEWVGPVASVYGWHLVRIEKIQKGEVPDLNEVWDIVEREWTAKQKALKKKEEYALMRKQYKVVFEDSKITPRDDS